MINLVLNDVFWNDVLVGCVGWNDYADRWDITNADPDIPGFAPCRKFLENPKDLNEIEEVVRDWLKIRDLI